MRFKNRYILIEIQSHTKLDNIISDPKEILNEIRDQVMTNFGLIGYSKVFSSIKIIYFNMDANYILFRVSRNYFETFKNVLFFMRRLKEIECRLKILFVTGTIKKVEEKLFFHLKKRFQQEFISLEDLRSKINIDS